MTIQLANGTTLTPIVVMGGKRTVQGAVRDALAFVFPASEGVDTLDALFSVENCTSISITADDSEAYIHKGYTIRAELSKAAVETQSETADAAAIYEDRITVVMAQKTYTETLLEGMQGTDSIYDELAAAYAEGVNSI